MSRAASHCTECGRSLAYDRREAGSVSSILLPGLFEYLSFELLIILLVAIIGVCAYFNTWLGALALVAAAVWLVFLYDSLPDADDFLCDQCHGKS